MTTTALFIQRDASYLGVVRKLRGTMTREEWDHPGHRAAAIIKQGNFALATIKQSDTTYEFIAPCPVTLYISPVTGAVVVADISRPGDALPVWITKEGINLLVPPPLTGLMVRRTTYGHWAEGPLPHVELGMIDAPTPDHDPEVQRIRAQNSALREAIDRALGPSQWAQLPRTFDPNEGDQVDFRLRFAFRVKDYQPLISKQAETGKLRTSDGMIELGGDD